MKRMSVRIVLTVALAGCLAVSVLLVPCRAAEDRGKELCEAAGRGDLERVKYLISVKADLNARESTEGNTPIMIASYKGHTDIVQALIAAGAVVNAKNDLGGTALGLAAGTSRIDIIRILVAAKANVNAKDKEGDTALIIASGLGKTAAVKALIAAKADVNIRDKDGYTALMLAQRAGHTEIVKLLKQAGAKK